MKKIRLMSMLTLVLLLGGGLMACDNVKDSDLQMKAHEMIATNPDAAQVKVMVVDKVATLNGMVQNEEAKSAIVTTVKEVKGIKSVVDNITVVPPAPDYTDLDAALNAAMPDLLKDHPKVHAEVKDGVVTLTGELKEKQLPMLMEKVSALNPLKVENKITIVK